MNNLKKILALSLVALAAGCGGGGGGSDTVGGGGGGTPTTPTVPPVQTPDSTVVTDPVTGQPAPGTKTTAVSGKSYKGATITAYSVQPDGSNGAALGPTATADDAGNFSLSLAGAPSGMVRLVSTGGSFVANSSDSSVQPVGTLELVTPYVTSTYNTFKISPLTNIASRAMTAKAKAGATLTDAFKSGMRSVLELDTQAHALILDDTTVYMNLLRGTLKSDKVNTSGITADASDLTLALEYFGMQYDLPSATVYRVLASAAETGYLASSSDGSGAQINVGQWVGGSFDNSAPYTLQTLLGSKRANEVIAQNMIMDFYVYYACNGGGLNRLNARYPFLYEAGAPLPKATCDAATTRVLAITDRAATNNRAKMK